MRLQGCLVSEPELDRLINYWKHAADDQHSAQAPDEELIQGAFTLKEMQEPKPEPLPGQVDDLLDKAIDIVRQEGRASTTLLQRRLRVGYARAARIIEAMEEQGIVGPDLGGSRGREVLIGMDG
jgi:S-DNA-T family DNA segregation ATPase FtsK/SpoIIIE